MVSRNGRKRLRFGPLTKPWYQYSDRETHLRSTANEVYDAIKFGQADAYHRAHKAGYGWLAKSFEAHYLEMKPRDLSGWSHEVFEKVFSNTDILDGMLRQHVNALDLTGVKRSVILDEPLTDQELLDSVNGKANEFLFSGILAYKPVRSLTDGELLKPVAFCDGTSFLDLIERQAQIQRAVIKLGNRLRWSEARIIRAAVKLTDMFDYQ